MRRAGPLPGANPAARRAEGSPVTTPQSATPASWHPEAGTRQQGMALIVALVLLAVIGLTSAAVMRGSLNSDLMANTARVQSLATQAAHLALRYCESELVKPSPAIPVLAARASGEPGQWEDFGKWFPEGGDARTVPDAWLKSADGGVSATQRSPQCLAEHSPLGGTAYIVTARGFSPDFSEDSRGRTQTGSVVWLQSQLLLGS